MQVLFDDALLLLLRERHSGDLLQEVGSRPGPGVSGLRGRSVRRQTPCWGAGRRANVTSAVPGGNSPVRPRREARPGPEALARQGVAVP